MFSSVGRAARLHREGQEFESLNIHQNKKNIRWMFFLFNSNIFQHQIKRPYSAHFAVLRQTIPPQTKSRHRAGFLLFTQT